MAPYQSEGSGDSWSEFMELLKRLGLDPNSITTDGGKGMFKAIQKVFPDAIQLRDLFHVLHKN